MRKQSDRLLKNRKSFPHSRLTIVLVTMAILITAAMAGGGLHVSNDVSGAGDHAAPISRNTPIIKPNGDDNQFPKNSVERLLSQIACLTAPANLVQWFRAEGNANDAFAGNHGVLQNGAAFSAGLVGQAFSFDGIDDGVSIGRSIQDDFTIEFWLNTTQQVAGNEDSQWWLGRGLVDGEVSSVTNDFGVTLLNGKVLFGVGNPDTTIKSGFVADGNWHHVAATRVRSTGEMKLYMDGVQVSTATGGKLSLTAPPNLALGRLRIGSNPFKGLLDEISIYNRVLSPADIQGIFSAGSNGKCPATAPCFSTPANLVSSWSAEGNANDKQGLNNGTLQNGTTFSSGKIGQAFSLDGLNDYVRIPDSASLHPGNVTLEAWINFSANPGVNVIFAKTVGNGVLDSHAVFYEGGRLQAVIGDLNSEGPRLQYAFAPVLGIWYHVAYTFDDASNTQVLYLNGVAAVTGTVTKSIGYDNHPFLIGADTENGAEGTFPFPGLIDETSIYDRALSQAEIQSIFSAGTSGKCGSSAIQSLSFNPNPVNGGQVSTGTVTLNTAAPSGGALVSLSSGNMSVATVPSSITIAAGQTTGTFIVTTSVPVLDSTALITASFQSILTSANLTVLAPKPDLTVSAASVPASTQTDAAFNIAWTVKNQGQARANAPWADRVYVSSDNQIGNDTLIGEFPFSTNLDPNQTTDRIQTLSIPRSAISQDGPYFLLVQIDANNQVDEGINEGNNFVARPINITRPPTPDLVVVSILAPDSASFGDTIPVQWTVKNIGGGPTNAPGWLDFVYLSPDSVPEIEDPFKISVTNLNYLAAGESYTATVEVKIPQGLVGPFKIIVWTDGDGTNHRSNDYPHQVIENNDENNYGVARSIQINRPLLPDLQTISVVAPEQVFAGTQMPLTWQVKNLGDGVTPPAQTNWVDKIYLSENQTLDVNTDRLVGSRPRSGALVQNEAYTISNFNVTLPNDIAGDWFVFMLADGDNQVYELNENNNADYDRQPPAGSPMHIPATPPDLVVPNSLTAPASGSTGESLSIGWTVKNQGPFEATPNWFDAVYLSADQTLDTESDTLLTSVFRSNSLGPGLTYTVTADVNVPPCIGGTYYLFALTDSRRQIFELNAESNNASQPRPIQIVNASPDLRVTALTQPSTGNAGQQISVNWTVANQGAGATVSTNWTDRVYLSRTQTFDSATALLIGSFDHAGALNSGANYTRAENLTIPNTAQGSYFVIVLTDANNELEECANNANNIGVGGQSIAITNDLPDLVVQTANAQANPLGGQTISVDWTVSNQGTVAVNNPSWGDAVYFSNDAVLGNDDLRLATSPAGAPLGVGATYNRTVPVTLPVVLPGNYFLIIQADYLGNVFEGQREDNNLRTVTLAIQAPLVDLAVSAVDAPASAFSGQDMTVNWSVRNNGSNPTLGSHWIDEVVLSLDQVDDPSDRVIGSKQHDGVLNGQASYNDSLSVFVPQGFAQQCYVFVRTDRRNEVGETNESNNSAADGVVFNLTPPADLVVSSVTPPPSASPGEPITISWTIQNSGQNPATGLWNDGVYLSSDQTWDIGDILVGRQSHAGPVAASQSYNGSLSVTLPAVSLGSYYVIVRTDVQNRVRETLEDNNTRAGNSQTPIDVTTLEIGVPRNTTLVAGQERFYKTNTPANESVRFTLEGQLGSANELFVRFGQIASRTFFDFSFSRSNEPNQEIIVPNSQAGNYFTQARSSFSIPSPQNVTVRAELIPFGITSVSPNRIGDNGQVTITLKGGRFEEGATVKLFGGGTTLTAVRVIRVDSSTLKARFSFNQVPLGPYDVTLTNPGGNAATSTQAITIETAKPFQKTISINGDRYPRLGATDVSYVILRNTGNIDLPYLETYVSAGQQLEMKIRPASSLVIDPDGDGDFAGTFRNGTTIAVFYARDIAPNEEIPFVIKLEKYGSDPFSFEVNANVFTVLQQLFNVAGYIESARQFIIDQGTEVSPEMAAYLGNALTFREHAFAGLADQGFFSQEEVSAAITPDEPDPTVDSPENGVCAHGCISPRIYIPLCVSKGIAGKSIADFGECLWEENGYCINPALQGIPQCDCRLGQPNCKEPRRPIDPNEKKGPGGFGAQSFVSNQDPLPYTISFENVSTATAYAQRVHITDQLDLGLDPRTLRLKEIGFKQYRFQVPENRAFFQQRIQLGPDLGNVLADISAGIDISTGRVTWTLTAIDPGTGEQPNSANLGLLPPNNATNDGQGFVTFTVKPKSTVATGVVIHNEATITFDTEAPINTNVVSNTIDAEAPSSAVNLLAPTQPSSTFVISWSGQDAANGSGLLNYDIFFSVNNGPYQTLLSGTNLTATQFNGLSNASYRFYSIARDNSGNVETAPGSPDAVTIAGAGSPSPLPSPSPSGSPSPSPSPSNSPSPSPSPSGSPSPSPSPTPPICTYILSPASAMFAKSGGNGSFSVTAPATCAWVAQSNATWISTSSTGSGNGGVNFVVDSNTGAERVGTISVAGQSFAISQSSLSAISGPLPGDLDLTFGVDGTVTTDFGNNLTDSAYAVAVQPDGKVVAVGYVTTNTGRDFGVIRLNPNGALDTTFSDDGKLSLNFNSGTRDDIARAVAIQPDGRIVVAGEADVTGFENFDIVLARLNTDGTLDPSFGNNGKVITNLPGNGKDYGRGLVLQLDGKIVVAGYSARATTGDDFAVLRYNTNGSLDTTFDSDGIVTTDILTNREDRAAAIALQMDGRILVAGYTNSLSFKRDFAVVRYNTNGSLDSVLNGTGKVTTDLNLNSEDIGNAIALQSDGKFFVAGQSAEDFGLVKYNANGSVDTAFGGGDGIVTTNFGSNAGDSGRGVVVQLDGKITVAGRSRTELAFARYNVDGTLDTSLDKDGLLVQNAGNNQLSPFGGYSGMALQSDGKIVAVGDGWRDSSGNDFTVSRLNSNGTFDFSFDGGDGIASTDVFGFSDEIADVAILAEGKIVVAGTAINSTGSGDFVVARYNPNGTLDTSFDGDGIVTTDFQGQPDSGQALGIQADGKIIIAGHTRNPTTFLDDGVLIRYNTNGSLDSSFGTGGIVVTVGNRVGTDANVWLYPRDIAIQLDGKILVAGVADYISIYAHGYVARYNSNGSLDNSFLTNIPGQLNGSMVVDFGNGNVYNEVNAVALQPDGRIVVAGFTDVFSNGGPGTNLAVARLNSNGSLDASFNGDGKVTTDFGNNTFDAALDVEIQTDGKIVAVGHTAINFIDMAVARYNSNGSLDTTFGGGDGKLNIDFNTWGDAASAVALQPDGKIILGGYADLERNFGGFALVRLTPSGSFDTSFANGNGRLITNLGEGVNTGLAYAINDMAVQTDGKIILAGAVNLNSTNRDLTMVRYENSICNYSLNSIGAGFAANGGNGSFTITAASSSCGWSANSDVPWITIGSGGSGAGNGTVNYAVTTNVGSVGRSGTIMIAGQSFAVNQAPSAWEAVALTAGQVEIRTWTTGGRTYAYLKLLFPNSGYRVVNWGQPLKVASDFTTDALVERYTGASVEAVTTTAQIYDLGALAPGNYNFTFKSSGTVVKTLAFSVSSATPPPNPIDDARTFVKQQYRDFLNREADQAGEDFWTDNITKCNDPARRPPNQTVEQCTLRQRETTSGAFFLSPEFQYTGYFVYRMYQGALNRQPKLSEFTPDALTVGNGIIVNGQLSGAKINQNKAAFAATFVNCVDGTKSRCAEFKAIYDALTNQQYVDKLFQTTGVNASAAERTALVNGLNANPATETRGSVLQKVVDGINVISEGNQQFTTTYGQAFYNAELNRAFVQLEYFGYMRRDPDEGGYAFWLGKLNQFGGDFIAAEMVLAFISSPEYRARFGQP